MRNAWGWKKWRRFPHAFGAAVNSLGKSFADELRLRLGKTTLFRIALVGLIAWLVLPIVWNDQPVIDVVNVPKVLQDEGYSSEVTERRIKDEIKEIEDSAKTSARKRGISLPDDSETPDIKMPGAGVSLQTVVRFVQHVLHIGPRHIIVDITTDSARPDALANINIDTQNRIGSKNSPADDLEVAVYCAEDDGSRPTPDRMQSEDVERVLPAIAQDVLKEADPYILGVYVDDHGNHEQAVSLFKKAIELDGKNAYAYEGWDFALCEMGRYDEAIKKCQKAIELDPNDPEFPYPYNDWGIVLGERGMHTAAIPKFQKAIEVDPNGADAYLSWGLALEREKSYDLAIMKYEKAIELDPKFAYAYNNWGYALYNQEKYNEAIAKYEKAIELDPKYAHAYNNWGIALDDEGKYNEATAKYERATELDPEDAQAYENWAGALDQMGKHDEADAKRALATKIRAQAQGAAAQ